MKKTALLFYLLLYYACAYSQDTITGLFPDLANQQVKLVGFTGFDTYIIDTTQADKKGVFNLLEKRSLYKASEYLAIKLLNEQACTINNDLR